MKLSYLKIAAFAVMCSVSINVQAVASSLTTQWLATIFGGGIGYPGLMSIDINNDGIEEIVFTSSIFGDGFYNYNNSYSVLSYYKLSKTWAISRQSIFPGKTTAITAAATYRHSSPYGNNNAMLALAVLDLSSKATNLKIIDLTANRLIKSISLKTGGSTVTKILTGDGDNDGQNEVIAFTQYATYLFNLSDFTASGNLPYGTQNYVGISYGTVAPQYAALGNVDTDTDKELVYGNGKVISYKNGQINLEWSYSPGFGNFALGNIDTDTPEEIIAPYGSYIEALDADTHSIKWHVSTGSAGVRIFDINKDGKKDIVYVGGGIHALDNNGTEFWTLNDPMSLRNMTFFDADADGDLDVILGGLDNSYTPSNFAIYDVTSKKQLFFYNNDIIPPFNVVAFGDIDNDGQQEFITTSSIGPYLPDNGIILVRNADTGMLKWKSGKQFLGYNNKPLAAAVGDVDRDGKNELVLVGNANINSNIGRIYLVDAKNHTLKKTIDLSSTWQLDVVKIADIDGDGYQDIITGGGYYLGYYLYIVDGATGTVKWQSDNLRNTPNWGGPCSLEIADFNGDGHLDILASLDYLYIIDGVTHGVQSSIESNYAGISIRKLPTSTGYEIVAGNSAGELRVLNSNLMTTEAIYPLCATTLIGAVEMLSDSKILFTCNDELNLFDLVTQSTIWSSVGKIAASTGVSSSSVYNDLLAVTSINGTLKVGLGANFSRLMRYNP